MAQYIRHPNRSGTFPPVVQSLLIGNAVIFGLQLLGGGQSLVLNFALWPPGTAEYAGAAGGLRQLPEFQLWQLITYAFLHGGFLHLFFNMFALWMFGTMIEQDWGSRRFLAYYSSCVVGAGIAQLLVAAASGTFYPTIGASGGVFGILLAFGMRFPNQYILLLIPPIPMKAKYFVLIFGAIELFLGITGTQAGVANFAHLGGMLTGLVLILYWRGKLPIQPKERMR